MRKQVSLSTTKRFEHERQNYLKELAKLRVKYSIIFQEIAKETQSEQIAAANR